MRRGGMRRATSGTPSSFARQPVHLKHVQPAAVGAEHLHAQAVYGDRLAAPRKAPEAVQHEPSHRVEVGIGERGAEDPVEIADLGLRLYAVEPTLLTHDVV